MGGKGCRGTAGVVTDVGRACLARDVPEQGTA